MIIIQKAYDLSYITSESQTKINITVHLSGGTVIGNKHEIMHPIQFYSEFVNTGFWL